MEAAALRSHNLLEAGLRAIQHREPIGFSRPLPRHHGRRREDRGLLLPHVQVTPRKCKKWFQRCADQQLYLSEKLSLNIFSLFVQVSSYICPKN
jgi:hypothetical protein